MGKPNYNFKPQVESKCAKARGSDLRCHFKNTRETVRDAVTAIRGNITDQLFNIFCLGDFANGAHDASYFT